MLRLDDSTRLLAERSRSETNAGQVRAIAEEIERNKELAELLHTARNPAVMREWLLLASTMSWSHGPTVRFAKEHFLGPQPTAEGLEKLNRARELDMDDYLLIDGQPLWAHQAYWAFRTGPRTDELRADGLRYFEDKPEAETAPILLYGAQPFSQGTLSAQLDYAPAPDFWPKGLRADQRPDGVQTADIPEGRPHVGFLVGLTDINCDKQENPRTEQRELVRPTTGWMVQVTEDSIRWIALRETERGSYARKQAFEERVVAEERLSKHKGPLPVRVEVRGKAVTVKVGSTKARFVADDDLYGFAGLLVRGPGYVGIDSLSLHGAR